MGLPEVMENLANILKQATNTSVKTAWISPNDNIPLITIIQFGGGSEIMALTNRQLRTYEFQLDIWAKSAKQRDQIAEQVMEVLLKNWRENYRNYGWWAVHVYRSLDIEEEGVFRKTMIVTIKEVVA